MKQAIKQWPAKGASQAKTKQTIIWQNMKLAKCWLRCQMVEWFIGLVYSLVANWAKRQSFALWWRFCQLWVIGGFTNSFHQTNLIIDCFHFIKSMQTIGEWMARRKHNPRHWMKQWIAEFHLANNKASIHQSQTNYCWRWFCLSSSQQRTENKDNNSWLVAAMAAAT